MVNTLVIIKIANETSGLQTYKQLIDIGNVKICNETRGRPTSKLQNDGFPVSKISRDFNRINNTQTGSNYEDHCAYVDNLDKHDFFSEYKLAAVIIIFTGIKPILGKEGILYFTERFRRSIGFEWKTSAN